MGKPRILIAGGGYAEIPLVAAAKKLGFHVITSGNRTEDLAHKFSDQCCLADFSDQDAMLALAKEQHIDAICPCANDFSAISAAYVAEQLGLPGHDDLETCKLLHHKDSFREFAIASKIPAPAAAGYSDIKLAKQALGEFSYPVIIKPVDLTGGKGISRVDNSLDASDALEKAFSISREHRVVIEDFILGSRHGFSVFIRNGKVVFYFADDEHYYLNPYMVSGASTPGSLPGDVHQKLIQQTEKIASSLQLKDGLVHIQFILHGDDPVIIEICRRPPGDLYIQFVQIATGIDYPSWIVRSFSGLPNEDSGEYSVKGGVLRHCVMGDKNGRLNNISFSAEIESNVIDKLMWWKPGDRVENFLTAKFGIVFLQFGSVEEMKLKISRINELIAVAISSDQ